MNTLSETSAGSTGKHFQKGVEASWETIMWWPLGFPCSLEQLSDICLCFNDKGKYYFHGQAFLCVIYQTGNALLFVEIHIKPRILCFLKVFEMANQTLRAWELRDWRALQLNLLAEKLKIKRSTVLHFQALELQTVLFVRTWFYRFLLFLYIKAGG